MVRVFKVRVGAMVFEAVRVRISVGVGVFRKFGLSFGLGERIP